MKPPVEHIRVSSKGKEILIRVKRHTGLQHWNEICRVALCRSLANQTLPPKADKAGEGSIEMEWKTFAGAYQQEFATLILLRAKKDGINLSERDELSEYLRAHVERGIASLQSSKKMDTLVFV